jgi:hypothetical protein
VGRKGCVCVCVCVCVWRGVGGGGRREGSKAAPGERPAGARERQRGENVARPAADNRTAMPDLPGRRGRGRERSRHYRMHLGESCRR